MPEQIFSLSHLGDVLIVTPLRCEGEFRYQDLHVEANSIRMKLSTPGISKVVVNLEQLDYFGSEFVGSLISLLRECARRGGKGCFCSATPNCLDALSQMGLAGIWPHYESCEEALLQLAEPA